MNPSAFYRHLLPFALLLVCTFVQAQQKQYVFNRLSVREGLASDYVYSILQDRKGFMWFGTANGLQRYDGRKIIGFKPHPSDTSFLPAEPISQMLLDTHDRFWVRLGKEVGLFDVASFVYRKVPMDVPRQQLDKSDVRIWEDNEGNIFLTVSAYGILVYNAQQQSFVRDTNIIDAPQDAGIGSFQQDAEGNYWIGTRKGLLLFHRRDRKLYDHANNPIQNTILKNQPSDVPVLSFFMDRQSRLWTNNWLPQENTGQFTQYDIRRQKTVELKSFEPELDKYHELHGWFQLSNNRIWAYGLNLLVEYNEVTGAFTKFYNQNVGEVGIHYDKVHCFYEDRENNVWLGTDRGIYIFNPAAQKFNSISLVENVPFDKRSFTSFTQLSSGDIVAGSWGQGIFSYSEQFKPQPHKFYRPAPADGNYYMVWNMHEHSSTKKIWSACQAGRLMITDPVSGKSRYLNHPVFNQRTIRTVTEDKNGNLWFGTQYGRLIKWDPRKATRNLEDGFELVHEFSWHIYMIKCDDDGLLWIATDKEGVVVMNNTGNIITSYTDKGEQGKTLYRNAVYDLLFYDDSLVVIGATVLNMLNRKTGDIKHITTEHGLPGNTVSTVQRDDEGNVWIGLINGLCRYNIKRNIFTLFAQRDGIVRNEFATGKSYKLKDGRLVFGNSHDFVYFNPTQILSPSAPPDVSITDFKLFNTYLPPDSILQLEKIVLPHNENSITIEFAALSFLQKDKMVYYTKMEGIDDDWSRVDKYNVANFALLPPGEYTFKVKCENGDGIPSKNVTSLRIWIKPPFWQQGWFIMLGILALGGLIYLAHRIRVRQLMQMEKVRGRIARDLHDDMGSTLSTINILSEMAKMKVNKDTEKTSEYISKISDNSNRMMEAMDDIVWSINPINDSMQRITARMREFATGVLEAKDIEVVFKVDDKVKDLRLGMESRRDFFLVFKEAVNNVAKYSKARHANIDISVESNRLIMTIKDDGVGFNVEQADSGNGLTNMHKRAESIKGSLLIDSKPGVGTLVRLESPLT